MLIVAAQGVMTKGNILLLALLLGCGQLFAQFSDSTHYYLKYASTGSMNHTNDGRAYLLNNALGFKVSKRKITLNANAAYIYGQQNSDLTNNDFSAAVDFNLYRDSSRLYYWGLASYDKSYSLKINDRFQGGFGLAYDVLNKPNAQLNISDGLLFENNDLMLNDTVPDVYQTFRNSLRLQYKFTIANIVVLEGRHFLQNSLYLRRDYIIKSNTSLSVKLRSWLSVTAAMTYNKLNRTNRENLLMNYGLTVEKYF